MAPVVGVRAEDGSTRGWYESPFMFCTHAWNGVHVNVLCNI